MSVRSFIRCYAESARWMAILVSYTVFITVVVQISTIPIVLEVLLFMFAGGLSFVLYSRTLNCWVHRIKYMKKRDEVIDCTITDHTRFTSVWSESQRL